MRERKYFLVKKQLKKGVDESTNIPHFGANVHSCFGTNALQSSRIANSSRSMHFLRAFAKNRGAKYRAVGPGGAREKGGESDSPPSPQILKGSV